MERKRFRIPVAYPLVSLAVLFVLFGVFFQNTLGRLYDEFELKLFSERKFLLDLICDESEPFPADEAFVDIMASAFSRIDTRQGTYGALFDADMRLISARTPQFAEAPFDPADYPELLTMMRVLDRGETNIWFDKSDKPAHTLRVYFRRLNGLYAFVGVSRYAIEPWFGGGVMVAARLLSWASYACLALVALSLWTGRRRRQ